MKPYLIMPLITLLGACSADDLAEPQEPEPVTIASDFNQGAQGWSAGFSDYPVADADIYELESGITELPTDAEKQGFRLKGMNRSDDLFMFMKGQVINLFANTTYTIHGSITFLSNGAAECFGVGGAPGESVYVKLGASEIEPEQADFYLNIDKGNQSQPGNDAIVIGDIAAEGASCDGDTFGEKTITVAPEDGFEIQSSDDGKFWIMLGTDSGYEGLTDLYFTSVNLTLTP